MRYDDATGALLVANADGDGLHGLFTSAGAMRVAVDDGGSGTYDPTGALRVHDASDGPSGVYDTSGAVNVIVAAGDESVGATSPSGAWNVIGL